MLIDYETLDLMSGCSRCCVLVTILLSRQPRLGMSSEISLRRRILRLIVSSILAKIQAFYGMWWKSQRQSRCPSGIGRWETLYKVYLESELRVPISREWGILQSIILSAHLYEIPFVHCKRND